LLNAEGVLTEQGSLFGRLDVRTRSVLSIARHFEYDALHSHHVAQLANRLFDDTLPLHSFGDAERKLLQYAALLHDIGFRVSPNDHHRHSLYLIKNSEMPGFMANEIAMIATIARYHRGSMPKKPKSKRQRREHEDYFSLKRADRSTVLRLAAILQIADGLDRSHSQKVKNLQGIISNEALTLTIGCEEECDLEMWSAERKAKWFSDIFRLQVKIEAVSTNPQLPEQTLFSVAD
jgi:exopolyphosphatase / guanosine-5'-triphosphate,3'-diphosphate pyrophosphatase